MWVLLTGMSGSGKSTLIGELRRRGFTAYDADADGFTEPGPDGRWAWRLDAVQDLLRQVNDRPTFFAGFSEEQGRLPFALTALLSAPESVLVERLAARTTNTFGKDERELLLVRTDLQEVEPRLRATADLVLDTTAPVETVADLVVQAVTMAAGR